MQQQQDVYLIRNQKEFWHCQLLNMDPVSIQLRNGQLNKNWEKPETVVIKFHKFPTVFKGLEAISNLVTEKLRQGYHEIQPAEIVKSYDQELDNDESNNQFLMEVQTLYNQYQQNKSANPQINKKQQMQQKVKEKVKKKINDVQLMQPKKPIIALIDDVTNGKQFNPWPRHKNRSHLGETHDLGPEEGGNQNIPWLQAQNWEENQDPTGMYMTERLDGMRIMWTGSEMLTKNGNSINFPASFIEGWPTTYLDGQLWIDREKYAKLVSIVRKRQPDHKAWLEIKFIVFDAPMLQEVYSERYSKLKKVILSIKNPHLVYIPNVMCQSREHLMYELNYVQQIGGEGLMLRDPNSQYEGKRSYSLQKVKSTQDGEATIVGIVDGTGKLEGSVGSFRVVTKNNVEFNLAVGLRVNARKNPPNIGTKVTFKYYGLCPDGKPRFPAFDKILARK